MAKNSSAAQNWPIFLILLGVATYIVVDSGVIVSGKLNSLFSFEKAPPVQSSEQALRSYSKKLNQELSKIENQILDEKGRLKELQLETVRYEKIIKDQRKSLDLIDKEIQSLGALKQSLVAANNRTPNAAAKIIESPVFEPAWKTPPRDWTDVLSKLTMFNSNPHEIIDDKYGRHEYKRLKTPIIFDENRPIYLTQRGIRQIKIFSEASVHLGFNKLSLAYDKDDSMANERAGVIKNFITARYKDQVQVEKLRIEDGRALEGGVELWVNKEAQQ